MDLRDAVVYHQLVLNAEGAKRATTQNYLRYQRLLLEGFTALGIANDLSSLSTVNVRRTLDWYKSHQRSGSSRDGQVAGRQFIERIKTFANFLEREDIIPAGTLLRLRPPKVDKHLRQPFTPDELTRMWRAASQSANPHRDEALFLLLLDSGMRIGEAVALTTDTLQLEQRRLIIGAKGKGRRERAVPVGDAALPGGGRTLRALRTYLAVRPKGDAREVFLSKEGSPITAASAGLAIQRLGTAAGVQNPIPHRLRHTFATAYLTMFQGDETGLRRIIGHCSKEVLADYVHLAATTVADRASKASVAETLLAPAAPADPPAKSPPSQPAPVAVLDTSASDQTPDTVSSLIAALQTNAHLRRALLDALLGDAA